MGKNRERIYSFLKFVAATAFLAAVYVPANMLGPRGRGICYAIWALVALAALIWRAPWRDRATVLALQAALIFGIAATVASNYANLNGIRYANGFAGSDACAKIAAALSDLPSTGGRVEAGGFSGLQPCASSPVSGLTKPFLLLLGATTYQTAVPWIWGSDTVTDQYVSGSGPDNTVIQPTLSFTGAAVLQLQPSGSNVIFRQAGFSDLSVDMANVQSQVPIPIAVSIKGGSNLPLFKNIVIKNQAGEFVDIDENGAGHISEGITWQGWYFYSNTPKQAAGVIVKSANQVVFRDGKLLGSSLEGSQIGFLVQATDSSYPGEGFELLNSSVTAYPTGITLSSTGAWAPSANAVIEGNTFEYLTTAINLAGYNGSNVTSNNFVAFNQIIYPVAVTVKADYASYNLILATPQVSNAGQMTFTTNSLNNTLIQAFGASDKSDVSDSGSNDIIMGGLLGVLNFGAISASKQFTSTVSTGTAPFSVSSTTPVANLAIGLVGTTASIGGSSLSLGACASGTVSIAGSSAAVTGGAVIVTTPNTYPGAGFDWSRSYLSSSNTVTVQVCADVAGTPTASTYNIAVVK